MPRPGAVVGDQVATGGLPAWRLEYTSVRFDPRMPHVPPGPRVVPQPGRLIRTLIFCGKRLRDDLYGYVGDYYLYTGGNINRQVGPC